VFGIIIKKYRNNILLFFIILFFSIFINYTSFRLYNLYYINANSNFNNHSIIFSLTNSDSDLSPVTISKEQIFTGCNKTAVYSRLENSGMDIYKVLYSDLNFKVEEGTYFTKDELNDADSYYAVAGSLADEITNTSNILISGHRYTVKGTFNDNKKPSNNYTIFINDNSAIIPLKTQMILDGRTKSEIRRAFSKISDNASACGLNVKVYENENISPEYFIRYQKPLVVIFVFIIIVILFLNFVLSIFWLYSYQRNIAVLYLVGKEYYHVFLKVYILITLVSNAAGLIVSFLTFLSLNAVTIGILTFTAMELIEIISVNTGFLYFSLKNTKELLEIDYE